MFLFSFTSGNSSLGGACEFACQVSSLPGDAAAAASSGPQFENLSVSAAGETEDCDNSCFQITVAQGIKFSASSRMSKIQCNNVSV